MDKFENFHFFYRRMGANLNEKDYLFHSQDFYVHSHDYFEIYMFHRGDCKYLLNNQIIQLHENDIIVMNGSALHGPAPNHNVPYERSVINFSPEWIRAIINRLNVPEILTPFNQLENILLRDICPKKFEEIQGLLKKIHEKQLTMMSHTELTIERRMLEGVTTTLLIELLFIIYELTKTQVVPVPTGRTTRLCR
ncbi:AraC family ligand binding domain-containing protein [Gracilibacillus sp. JCM 18860]|uniref:AraC family ligand binding domain-containing protein n=1 Tax=Gracilibacillus sp. JCM 18860 TaxID=1306159 RepID=UPI0006D1BA39